MALASGARLGAYQVVALLGAGGMGEVYRARDTKLGRDVALKVLPSDLSGDQERLARFKREAQVLAGLNHPNIAHLYGFEDATNVPALVMELVEGPTLAEMIAGSGVGTQGSGDRKAHGLPLGEALNIARQIAEALAAAHDQGIVHRDLKPANVKVKDDGTVKVLDFGLAKALDTSASTSAPDATASPTITTPAMMTGVGVILGTAAYMSPEQARGKPADRRSDIWALGCVVYEMLTGRRAFEGDDISTTLARVIEREPEWSRLPPGTPPHIRTLLRRCLEKDRKRRLDSAADARLELDEPVTGVASSGGESGESTPVHIAASRRRAIAWGSVAALAGVAAGALGGWLLSRTRPQPVPSVQRLTITTSAAAPYIGDLGGIDIAISPDGRNLLYPVTIAGKRVLYLRPLDQFEGHVIPGTEDAANPFFSDDGEWVGFFTYDGSALPTNKLKKVAVRGGRPLTLETTPTPPGGSWLGDTIVYATGSDGGSPWSLYQVKASGGEPKVILAPDPKKNERRLGWPELLPGGKAVMFSVSPRASFEESHIEILSLDTGAVRTVIAQGHKARYVTTGHIVYMLGGTLMAVPFDIQRLEASGSPVPLVEGVRSRINVGEAAFAVSPAGFLVYSEGLTTVATLRSLVWVDRAGHEDPIDAPMRTYLHPRIAPDGSRIAVDAQDQESDIWTFDIAGRTLARFTFDPGIDSFPVWTPDGRRIIFGSNRGNSFSRLYSAAADNTGQPELLADSEKPESPLSTDGKRLVVLQTDQKNGSDLGVLDLGSKGRTVPLLHTVYNESNADVSPDGRWLAYQSNESGRDEVYVRPFPNVDEGKWQVSGAGGTRPLWAKSGRELFYLSGNSMMSATIQAGPAFSALTPQVLFERSYYATPPGRIYDVTADGRRFVMIKDAATVRGASSTPPQFAVVLNWHEELKARVPTR